MLFLIRTGLHVHAFNFSFLGVPCSYNNLGWYPLAPLPMVINHRLLSKETLVHFGLGFLQVLNGAVTLILVYKTTHLSANRAV